MRRLEPLVTSVTSFAGINEFRTIRAVSNVSNEFRTDEFLFFRREAHARASIRAVGNVSNEFAHAALWNCVYRRCSRTVERRDG